MQRSKNMKSAVETDLVDIFIWHEFYWRLGFGWIAKIHYSSRRESKL